MLFVLFSVVFGSLNCRIIERFREILQKTCFVLSTCSLSKKTSKMENFLWDGLVFTHDTSGCIIVYWVNVVATTTRGSIRSRESLSLVRANT